MKKIAPPLVVPKPCHAEWATMSGDEKKRFCGECGKHVYNLSAMSTGEAQRFADETQGRECVAYVRTDDGEMFAPNFIERLILRIAGWKPVFARLLALALPAALASCVSKNLPMGGKPVIPGESSVPLTRAHQGNTETGVMLGTPLVAPKPGKVAMPKK